MRPAPIELGLYFMTDLSVKARANFNPEAEFEAKMDEFSVKTELSSPPEGDANWQVTLQLAQQPAPETNFPYEFRVALVGHFRCVASGLSADQTEHLVRVNGSSMLYGVAREIIRANTERGPWTGIMLPTVSFFDPPNSEGKTSE